MTKKGKGKQPRLNAAEIEAAEEQERFKAALAEAKTVVRVEAGLKHVRVLWKNMKSHKAGSAIYQDNADRIMFAGSGDRELKRALFRGGPEDRRIGLLIARSDVSIRPPTPQ